MSPHPKASPLSGTNAAFVETLYERYLSDPEAVEPSWRAYFEAIPAGTGAETPHRPVREEFARLGRASRRARAAPGRGQADPRATAKQVAVLQLINAYRFRGHQAADLDPLHLRRRPGAPDLEPDFHGLTEEDMDRLFNCGSFRGLGPKATLADLLRAVRRTYCGTIGFEYMHITETARKRWLQERIEPHRARYRLGVETKQHILERLVAAKGLETYLHTRYVGQKRFSLEGGESLIPLLDELIQSAGRASVREIVLGMAHRGRLNVLVNIIGKSPAALFSEFEGRHKVEQGQGSGDVKYHQGFSSDIGTPGGPVHLALAFNPSHLEIIDPVVEGSVRARQERRRDMSGDRVLPVLIHGDAAFAGQGVVMETLNLSQTRGFTTGGTVHIVLNNQIGFTTSDPLDARSTQYCTDVIKMVQAPIFHVNGDDPEAVLFVTRLALEYRLVFHTDVLIDVVCYRRLGHNEADEPAVTQPMMYAKIKARPDVVRVYAEQLQREGVIAESHAQRLADRFRDLLDAGKPVSRPILTDFKAAYAVDWKPFFGNHWTTPADTAVPVSRVQKLHEALDRIPSGFVLHPRVAKIMEDRRKMAAGAMPLDWGFAEIMAYAALVTEGHPVRLCGQDSGRGTFFHRHAVLHCQEKGEAYIPLKHLDKDQARVRVVDSLLSEEAVLGFELGYSFADPDTLVLWEAQFGDFANGGQVVMDQFLSSSEAKWQRLSGLVLLLPHGYEGQGPEHSSARLERYLQLCAQENMQVCVPSTPAQMFHMLRRQMLRPYRKPLIVMSPKSLLRHPLSTSTLEDLSGGGFRCLVPEQDAIPASRVQRILLCSGKVYYDLLQLRRERGIDNIAILRIEQLYPFPLDDLRGQLRRYAQGKEVVWVQEEPRNQGAWDSIRHRLESCLGPSRRLYYIGRPASASPAVGYLSLHIQQQKALVDTALTLETPAVAGCGEEDDPILEEVTGAA